MISLNMYKEFGYKDGPSITEFFSAVPYEGMEKIIEYLENGKIALVSPGFGYDAITGERVMSRKESLTDGEYMWSSMLPYYIRTYYFRPKDSFVDKVLS